MIESNTVFVLGAGAHCSYGFPSGEELKKQAVAAVRQAMGASDERSFLNMRNLGAAAGQEVQSARCNAFAEALENAGQASIDAFLNANRHQQGFQIIGKGAIAQVLLGYEQRATTAQSDDDWLDYVFKVMVEGVSSPSEFAKNKIAFITFNYDRLLEARLLRLVKYSFGLDEKASLELLRGIPIHHVYGALGAFPDQHSSNVYAWILAAKEIRTIFDAEHDKPTIEAAKALLHGAQRICLLGFGFHRENVELLDLPAYAKACSGFVASSRYGVTDQEWSRLTRQFSGIQIQAANVSYRCLQAIRNLPIFY